jgi:putative membrane protein
MKNSTHFKTALLKATVITGILVVTSCSNSQENKDNKEVAEEHNEAKFGNTDKEEDAKFLVKAAEINLEEILLGKLAQQNSTVTDVSELGKMMEVEHAKCLSDLTALANKKSISIPTSAGENAQDAYKKLIGKSGKDFNTSYCDMMVNGHKDAIVLFEKESAQTNDADIKEWVTATLTDLHRHLDHAIACQNECKKMK